MRWILIMLGLEIPVLIAFGDWWRRSPDKFLGDQAGKDKWKRRLLLGLATGWLGIGNAVVVWYIMIVVRANTDGESLEVVGVEKAFVQATTEQCMAVVMDVDNYPAWSTGVTQAAVISRDSEGRLLEASFVRDAPMGGGEFSYTMAYSYKTKPYGVVLTMIKAETEDPEKAALIGQMMGTMISTYRFEANGDETLLEFELKMTLPPQIPAMIAGRMPSMLAAKTVEEIKGRIEHVAQMASLEAS